MEARGSDLEFFGRGFDGHLARIEEMGDFVELGSLKAYLHGLEVSLQVRQASSRGRATPPHIVKWLCCSQKAFF
jgi:hypothetical protein